MVNISEILDNIELELEDFKKEYEPKSEEGFVKARVYTKLPYFYTVNVAYQLYHRITEKGKKEMDLIEQEIENKKKTKNREVGEFYWCEAPGFTRYDNLPSIQISTLNLPYEEMIETVEKVEEVLRKDKNRN